MNSRLICEKKGKLDPEYKKHWHTKPADMRRSFDGLLALAKTHFQEDPYSGSLFIFRGSRGVFIKILWFDQDGFAIFSKRLEVGTFCFPDVRFVDGKYEPVQMQRAELLMMLEAIDTPSVKRLKRYKDLSRDQSKSTPQKCLPIIRKP